MIKPRTVLGRAAVVLGVLALAGGVAVLTVWSPGGGPDKPRVPLGGGQVTVDETLPATVPMASMPGMGSDADPIPSGKRRVSVNVRVQAGDAPLRPAAGDFRLRGPDGTVVGVHRAGLPADVPAGMSAAGPLIFQIPTGWGDGTLLIGTGQSIPVSLPAAPTGGAGHGSASGQPSATPDAHRASPGCCHH